MAMDAAMAAASSDFPTPSGFAILPDGRSSKARHGRSS